MAADLSPSIIPTASPIHAISQGQGQPVVLLHGMASSSEDWRALIPHLAQAGYRALAPDLLGHGESAKPDDPQAYTGAALLASFEDWLESQAGKGPLWLVGHSMGGYLAMRYALEHPGRVRGLVLINPLYERLQIFPLARVVYRRPELGKEALRLVPPWLVRTALGWDPTGGKDFSAEVRKRIASDFKRASPHIMYFPASLPDLTPQLPELDTPALIIWGVHDLTLHPASFPRLVSLLPKAAGKPISHSGHQPHRGKSDLVNHLILDYFAAG